MVVSCEGDHHPLKKDDDIQYIFIQKEIDIVMSVTPSWNRLVYDPAGQDQVIRVTYTGGMTYVTPVITYVQGGTGWLSCESETLVESDEVDVVEYVFRATSATGGGDTKIATITFEDQTGTADIDVYQITGYYPVWYMPVYTFHSAVDEEIHYRIYEEKNNRSNIVFEGLAITNIAISLNSLVYDYLQTRRGGLQHLEFQDMRGYGIFRLVSVEGATETDVLVWGQAADWSYLNTERGGITFYDENRIINDPINHKGSAKMEFDLCIYNADDSTDWTIIRTKKDGTTVSYNTSDNRYPFGARSVVVDNNTSKITFKKGSDVLMEYDTTYCGFGSFMYRNRFGGYDSFLIEANIKKKDDYTRDSSNMTTNSTVIRETFEVNTGWLTDEEAKKLVFHLLSSPDVTLQIFDEYDMSVSYGYRIVHPVNIVDSSAEYKKFRNGRKLVQYVITVQESTKNIVKR